MLAVLSCQDTPFSPAPAEDSSPSPPPGADPPFHLISLLLVVVLVSYITQIAAPLISHSWIVINSHIMAFIYLTCRFVWASINVTYCWFVNTSWLLSVKSPLDSFVADPPYNAESIHLYKVITFIFPAPSAAFPFDHLYIATELALPASYLWLPFEEYLLAGFGKQQLHHRKSKREQLS